MSPENKAYIEGLAREAGQKRVPIRDACPYPFSSPEGLHFAAVYALALPVPKSSMPPIPRELTRGNRIPEPR